MHVCQNSKSDVNCGKCEKCTATKLELLALGKLGSQSAFREKDVSTADIERMCDYSYPFITKSYALLRYLEIVPLLREIGRQDLVSSIENVVRFYSEMNGTSFYSDRIYRGGSQGSTTAFFPEEGM